MIKNQDTLQSLMTAQLYVTTAKLGVKTDSMALITMAADIIRLLGEYPGMTRKMLDEVAPSAHSNPSAKDFKDLIYSAIYNAPGGNVQMTDDVYKALEPYLRAPAPTPAADAPDAAQGATEASTEAEQMLRSTDSATLLWLLRHGLSHADLNAEILRRMRGGV